MKISAINFQEMNLYWKGKLSLLKLTVHAIQNKKNSVSISKSKFKNHESLLEIQSIIMHAELFCFID